MTFTEEEIVRGKEVTVDSQNVTLKKRRCGHGKKEHNHGDQEDHHHDHPKNESLKDVIKEANGPLQAQLDGIY